MIYQTKLADILALDGIVPTLKGNAVIPHRSMTVYCLVQLTITVIAIHLKLVGFHGSGLCPLDPVSQGSERPYWADRGETLPPDPIVKHIMILIAYGQKNANRNGLAQR